MHFLELHSHVASSKGQLFQIQVSPYKPFCAHAQYSTFRRLGPCSSNEPLFLFYSKLPPGFYQWHILFMVGLKTKSFLCSELTSEHILSAGKIFLRVSQEILQSYSLRIHILSVPIRGLGGLTFTQNPFHLS